VTPIRWLLLATALSAMLTLPGCTHTSPGTPMPNDAVTTGGEPDNTKTTSTESSSDRPREITLDDKDPCGLILEADWPKFDIKGRGEQSEEPTLKSPQCYYSDVGNVTLVMTEGIEAWTEGNRSLKVEDTKPIEGFPTITMTNEAGGRACFTAVDVADGQYLLTTATPNPNDPSKPEKCELAYQLAESAMKTLVAS
jgi:uncharacterized protein DUF3558